MHARALVKAALDGEEPPRPVVGPLAVHFCAGCAGISIREYTLDAARLAESVIAYWDTFRPDAVWVSSDTWVNASAIGASVRFVSEDAPLGGTGEALVRTMADIACLPAATVEGRGRRPLMCEALRRVSGTLNEVFVVGCFDLCPFSLACSLAGIERVMLATIQEPEFLEALLEVCTEHVTAYAASLAACNPDMLSTGDSPAIMLGPVGYRRWALPYAQRVFCALHDRAACPLSLHICGDSRLLLPAMVESGADVLEIDHLLDLEEACRVVPPDVALWGNLDPVGLLCQGSPDDVTRAAVKALDTVRAAGRRRFVLSSGCTLAPETPAENVHALMKAVHNRG